MSQSHFPTVRHIQGFIMPWIRKSGESILDSMEARYAQTDAMTITGD